MISYKVAAAVLFLGLVTVGQLPKTFGSSMMSNFARGGDDYSCDDNVVNLLCCQAVDGSCCGNILSGTSIAQCPGVALGNVDLAVIGAAVTAAVCSSSVTCETGACIADLKKLINEGDDKSAYYCCTGVDTKNEAFVCKNSQDKDILLQCSGKNNNRNDTLIARGGGKPETVTTECCTTGSCNTFVSGYYK